MGKEDILDQLESATVDELAIIIRDADEDQERDLRSHLGTDRFRRLRGLALRLLSSRVKKRGNVVFIPAFFGSTLVSVARPGGQRERLWLSVPRITDGRFERLQLEPSGQLDHDLRWSIVAAGVLKRPYAELLLTLALEWDVRAFHYDWRKDIRLAASSLESRLTNWFGAEEPVHLVTHGHGGLVARAFVSNYQKRWLGMAKARENEDLRRGGRLVMLGAANHGSFLVAKELFAHGDGVGRFKETFGDRTDDLVRTFRSFVGLFQMLPSPLVVPEVDVLYGEDASRDLDVPNSTLRLARHTYDEIVKGAFDDRMINIAGYGYPTITALGDPFVRSEPASYLESSDGDGVVPLRLNEPDHAGVRNYYIREEHGELVSNPLILKELGTLLATGRSDVLDSDAPPRDPVAPRPAPVERSLTVPRHDTQALDDALTGGLLGGTGEGRRSAPPRLPISTPSFEIGLVYMNIADVPDVLDGVPVDAISIGLYTGEKPQGVARDLDKAISTARTRVNGDRNEPSDCELILTQFVERGIIRGELGQPFFLVDPRPAHRAKSPAPNRVIAVAGMGLPGRFGTPELTVLVRELVWALGRIGKHHLASASIGTRNQLLPPAEAVSAWIRGIKHALTGSHEDDPNRLLRLTMVIDDPRKIRAFDEVLRAEALRSEHPPHSADVPRFRIKYANPWDSKRLDELAPAIGQVIRSEVEAAEHSRDEPNRQSVPTRVTLSLNRGTYRFGAVTATASVPEREIPLDPQLVRTANDELMAERNPALQLERGKFLERLLVPEDLRPALGSDAPLVMMLDATTARIHWEMIATPESLGTPGRNRDRESSQGLAPKELFLGTSRGFTRQLRTTFAPPPEPPPPPRRIIRILIVADPARDARLSGAELEGFEIAELFEQFNDVYAHIPNRVEVVRLFGPTEATRTNVLRGLMLRSFDVLHFAGHCVHVPDDPSASGWIFSNNERISANELRRIDRVPKFVFSNACESGITPDRADLRSPDLAPSFAESFFARGVSNFVCTAWPVDDGFARQFALELYMGLLGLESESDGPGPRRYRPAREPLLKMHRAMRAARLKVIESGGVRTWGAYQHYGNPDFRLFEPESFGVASPRQPAVEASPGQPASRREPAPATSKPRARPAKDTIAAPRQNGSDVF